MQVQATISAPGELAHKFGKSNLRRGDVHLLGVQWETADYICSNPKCGHVVDGYGNYVSNLKKENDRLKKENVRLEKAWIAMQKEKTKAVESEREVFDALQNAKEIIAEMERERSLR